MRPGEVVALFLRHKIAVVLVLVIAVAVLVDFKKTPPQYAQTGTVVFTPPVSRLNPNPYNSFGGSLVLAGDVVMRIMHSPATQQQIQAAGGTAAYTLSLVNLYNMEYPDYGDPYGDLTTSSTDPAIARRTFNIVEQKLADTLLSRQQMANVHRENRIGIKMVGISGPTAQYGSSKRAYIGFLLLTIIIGFSVVNGLDRRRQRRRVASRSRLRAAVAPDRVLQP